MRAFRRTHAIAIGSIFTVACSPIRGANPPRIAPEAIGRTLTAADATAELDTLFRTLEEVHPDIYSVWPRDSAAEARRALVSTLPASLTRTEWWLRLSPLVAKFGDGHTNLSSPREDMLRDEAVGAPLFAPAVVGDADLHLVISLPLDGNAGLARGDRLRSINGLDADSLMSVWMQAFSGEAPTFRAAQVAGSFRDLMFMHGMKPPFRVTVERGDAEQTVEIAGVPRDSLASRFRQRSGVAINAISATTAAAPPSPNFTYRVLQPGIGYMNFYSMSGDLSAFKPHVADMFRQVAADSLKTLVVDLRTNGGGDSRMGDEILRYITTTPYRGSARKEWKMSAQYRSFIHSLLRPPLSVLPVQYLFSQGRAMYSGPPGKVVSTDFPLETPSRAEPFFSGAVCVITGPGTFSSATDLADAIKTFRLATTIGDETGGRPNGFGEVYWFRLPTSGLLVSVSSARFVRASGDTTDHRGVMPDISVHPTAEQRRGIRDIVLDRAVDCPKIH